MPQNKTFWKVLRAYWSPLSIVVSLLSAVLSIAIAMHWLPRIPHLEMIRLQAFSFVWLCGFLTSAFVSYWMISTEDKLFADYSGDTCPSNLAEMRSIMDGLEGADSEFANLFIYSPLLVCIADFKTGTLLRVNPAWEELLGYTAEEIRSKPWIEFVHPDDVQKTIDYAGTMTKFEPGAWKRFNFVNRYRAADGS